MAHIYVNIDEEHAKECVEGTSFFMVMIFR